MNAVKTRESPIDVSSVGFFSWLYDHVTVSNHDSKCLFGGLVAKYSTAHPGGSRLIKSGADVGDNAASMLYLSYHITRDFEKIERIAQSLGFIGVSKIRQTELYRDLDDVFLSVKSKERIHESIYRLYCVFITLLFITSIFKHCASKTINLWNSILILFGWVGYGFAVFHIRHHSGPAFTGSRLLDNVLDIFDCVFAYPVQIWIDKHQNNHHLLTNTKHDNDAVRLYPYIYIKGYSFERRFYHRFQSFYAPFLFGLSQFPQIWLNLTPTKGGKLWCIPCYYSIWVVIPWMVNDSSFMVNLMHYVAIECVLGIVSVYLFAVSHNMEVNPHLQEIDTVDFDEWCKSQVEESTSWSNRVNPLNYVITMVLGGINTQIEHHIAPAVCPMYYLFASQEIKAVCKKHGIRYNESSNLFTAIYGFHRFIHNASR